VKAGHAVIDNEELAAQQLLGMIEGCSLWPKWLTPTALPDEHYRDVPEGAIRTWLARYATDPR
jgi:hypothetical protein